MVKKSYSCTSSVHEHFRKSIMLCLSSSITVNIGNARGRVHGWSRAHMVLFNSNSGRPETGCSFDLEADLKDERGEDASLKSFCNRATSEN